MAETKVFGVKVPEELHQEAAKMQKEFGTGEEFLAALITAYKTEKTKEQIPAVAEDFKELQVLKRRIDSIFLNQAYRVENLSKQKDVEWQDVVLKKESIIYDLQSKNTTMENRMDELTIAFNNAISEKDEQVKRVNELTNMYNDNKALIDEYKSKNDMLTGMLQKYEKYPEEIEQYKRLLADSQTRNMELDNNLRIKENEVKQLTSSAEELKEKHQNDVRAIYDQTEFQKEKALLDKDKEYQSILNKLNSEHNEKVRELLHENQEYNSFISKLVEEGQSKTQKINEQAEIIKKLEGEIGKTKTPGNTKKSRE